MSIQYKTESRFFCGKNVMIPVSEVSTGVYHHFICRLDSTTEQGKLFRQAHLKK